MKRKFLNIKNDDGTADKGYLVFAAQRQGDSEEGVSVNQEWEGRLKSMKKYLLKSTQPIETQMVKEGKLTEHMIEDSIRTAKKLLLSAQQELHKLRIAAGKEDVVAAGPLGPAAYGMCGGGDFEMESEEEGESESDEDVIQSSDGDVDDKDKESDGEDFDDANAAEQARIAEEVEKQILREVEVERKRAEAEAEEEARRQSEKPQKFSAKKKAYPAKKMANF